MSVVEIKSNYEIVIPESIQSKLGIIPGQQMMVTTRDGAIILTPIPADPIEFLCGALEGTSSLSEELIAERKKEVDPE